MVVQFLSSNGWWTLQSIHEGVKFGDNCFQTIVDTGLFFLVHKMRLDEENLVPGRSVGFIAALEHTIQIRVAIGLNNAQGKQFGPSGPQAAPTSEQRVMVDTSIWVTLKSLSATDGATLGVTVLVVRLTR
jgi:hypothetical protein